MKVFAFLPTEILGGNLSKLWEQLERKLKENYKNAQITSSYTGDGSIETSNVVVFLYDFRDYDSCKIALQKCKDLGIVYNFFTKFYTPDAVE